MRSSQAPDAEREQTVDAGANALPGRQNFGLAEDVGAHDDGNRPAPEEFKLHRKRLRSLDGAEEELSLLHLIAAAEIAIHAIVACPLEDPGEWCPGTRAECTLREQNNRTFKRCHSHGGNREKKTLRNEEGPTPGCSSIFTARGICAAPIPASPR